ncbi:hypothetical protein [Clostridium sp. HBUAS56017]|uniref:hypothetical protein n=1 Tax=Clostridium sp. HBUAS56017 TaxID=2571128 RepID=UPI0011775EE3|nr:hypothetical protein [Clostridium sp. HBUAS56017]
MYDLVKVCTGTLTILYLIVLFALFFREMTISRKTKGIVINTTLTILTLISLIYVAGSFLN